MSYVTYLASDVRLAEMENRFVRHISINEALERGIEVPHLEFLYDVDRNEPFLMYVEDENHFGELEIHALKDEYKTEEILRYMKKPFISTLSFDYNDLRADAFLKYLKIHFAENPNSQEIEIWGIWLGEEKVIYEQRYIEIEDMTYDSIKYIAHNYDTVKMTIHR